jgi:hypothetical protein
MTKARCISLDTLHETLEKTIRMPLRGASLISDASSSTTMRLVRRARSLSELTLSPAAAV